MELEQTPEAAQAPADAGLPLQYPVAVVCWMALAQLDVDWLGVVEAAEAPAVAAMPLQGPVAAVCLKNLAPLLADWLEVVGAAQAPAVGALPLWDPVAVVCWKGLALLDVGWLGVVEAAQALVDAASPLQHPVAVVCWKELDQVRVADANHCSAERLRHVQALAGADVFERDHALWTGIRSSVHPDQGHTLTAAAEGRWCRGGKG